MGRWRGAGWLVLMMGACTFDLPPPLVDGSGPKPVVLATMQAEPWAMAVDATHVYWTNLAELKPSAGSVMRVPKDGSSGPLTIGKMQEPGTVALDETYVYWSARINDVGRIVRRLKSNGSNSSSGNETVVDNLQDPLGLAVDADNLYWADNDRGTINKRAKNDPKAAVVELASGLKGPWLVALRGNMIYWTNRDGQSVMRVPKDGGATPQLLAQSLYDVFGIAVDDSAVFFRDADSKGNGRVMRIALDTLELKQLATTSGEGARFLAIDETTLYWTTGSTRDGSIMTALKDGSAASTLVGTLPGPRGIAVDDTEVFWSNYGGATVMKLPKRKVAVGP